MARARIRYPDDDFPIVLAIGALGAAGLLYLVVRRATAASAAAPAANVRLPAPARATPAPVALPSPSTASRADVLRRYREVAEQATFDTRGFIGQEAMLVQLVADLTAIGDTRAANDTRAILEAVRRL